MREDIASILLSEEQIHTRVRELGAEISRDYAGKEPLFVGVLKGCFIFMADLVRAAQIKSEIEFIGVSSYNNGTKSSGVVQITRDLQRDISGRDIIIVEDILDSGNTLAFLKSYLMAKGAKSISIVTLLDKPARREKAITAEQAEDLLFANKVVKHSKSNAIVLAKGKQLFASGIGQTSRVDALRQAIEKAKSFNFDLHGAVMASDAFFPFADCVEIAHNEGITAVIQPGGSIRDNETVDFCNKNGIAMVMTGIRHFKH